MIVLVIGIGMLLMASSKFRSFIENACTWWDSVLRRVEQAADYVRTLARIGRRIIARVRHWSGIVITSEEIIEEDQVPQEIKQGLDRAERERGFAEVVVEV